jgi:hypothetical protein
VKQRHLRSGANEYDSAEHAMTDTPHLAEQHYRPLFTGGAATFVAGRIGSPAQLRQIAMLVGSHTDACGPCISDMLDAVALDGDLMAVLHCVWRIVARGVLVPCDSEQGQATARAQWALPFPVRRAGAVLEADMIATWLADGISQE